MKLTGRAMQGWPERANQILGADPLTTILTGVAILLAAAIAAICVDLVRWPPNASAVHQASAPRGYKIAIASPLKLTPPASPSPTPSPTPTSTPFPAPVRIRIPAIGVDRSIMEVPLAYDSHAQTWTQDYDQLFRDGKPDLVGHYAGSAAPGQPGNTILVGHNYGYGVNGVFVRLGSLKAGQQVEVVTAVGQTFTYRVREVVSIAWTKKTEEELLNHQPYLSAGGPERLTLVTCGGRNWAPFPKRVYVVAVPAP